MKKNIQADPREGSMAGGQPVYFTFSVPVNEGLDLANLWKTIWAGKWIIAGIIATFAVSAAVYSLLATERYRAEVLLAPVVESGTNPASRLGGLASLAGISLQTGGNTAESLALLESKKFTEDFIQEKQLLPILFEDEWDPVENAWKTDDKEEQPDLRDGTKYFSERVRSVTKDAETGFVTLSIEWTDPVLARDWAMDLVRRINVVTREEHIRQVQQKLDYLNGQLASANLLELRQAVAKVIEEQISAMMMAQAQTEYAFKIIDPATLPKNRVWPQPMLIIIAATAFGALVGVFAVLVWRATRAIPAVAD